MTNKKQYLDISMISIDPKSIDPIANQIECHSNNSKQEKDIQQV